MIVLTWLAGRWRYVLVAALSFTGGLWVGKRVGATNPPPAISVSLPDAGVATARVTSGGTVEVASVTCRAEPPPPVVQRPRTIYVMGDPVQVECPVQPACPVLVCEGTASSKQGPLDARADSPVLPPAVVTVQTHESYRKWGIGLAGGWSEATGLHPGVSGSWQPIPEIETHVDLTYVPCAPGKNCVPVGVTAAVQYRF